jgi:hypothetical protein
MVIIIIIIIINMPRYPFNKSPASLKTLKNTQSGSYIIPQKLYANVFVIV